MPAQLVTTMKNKGMSRNSPVMVRIFQEKGKLEVRKQETESCYDSIAELDICTAFWESSG